MFIGVGQGGFRRSSLHTQMDKLSQTTTQSIADLTQGIGARQLTEQHRHKLGPTGESFGVTFGLMLRNQSGKLCSREMFQKLIKQTRDLYHSAALLFELVLTRRRRKLVSNEKLGGLFTLSARLFQTRFGQEKSMTAPTEEDSITSDSIGAPARPADLFRPGPAGTLATSLPGRNRATATSRLPAVPLLRARCCVHRRRTKSDSHSL